ncbi:zinc-dependent peptidase [Marinicella rhabdoformis]|uniref:M90 family metallopeptidase n=1 Tax=Marinicella rhabdoformis TaxID=2580566 RepID=UPI0012AEC979|nr:M90 family metallopeptidase [Marinicella rhabdoformis]
MSNQLALIFVLIMLLLAALFYAVSLIKKRRRKAAFKLPFPPAWEAHITKHVSLYKSLPQALQDELKGHINVFLSEKYFEGHNGIEITDEMRVVVAAQACLLLLNRETNYFPHLKTIMMYPSAFRNPNSEQAHLGNLGESWTRGPVVLSWGHSLHGGKNDNDGSNLVIHEFAHQLDQEDGVGDGTPMLEHGHIRTWAKVLSKEFNSLKIKKKCKRKSFFNKYGATNAAEFFAVISEHFFEQPKTFKKKHPDLYAELTKYYKLDPIDWAD